MRTKYMEKLHELMNVKVCLIRKWQKDLAMWERSCDSESILEHIMAKLYSKEMDRIEKVIEQVEDEIRETQRLIDALDKREELYGYDEWKHSEELAVMQEERELEEIQKEWYDSLTAQLKGFAG